MAGLKARGTKTSTGLKLQPAQTLEIQLICSCCGLPYYLNNVWEDRITAVAFGAEAYATCPLCTQAVSDEILYDEGYRQRYRDTVEKWRHVLEADNRAKERGKSSASEPTYEELKSQIARLENQLRGRLQFKVSGKGGISVYGLGRFPVTLYHGQWMRLLEVTEELREFLETNKARLKLRQSQR